MHQVQLPETRSFGYVVTPQTPCSSYMEWIMSCLLHKLEVLVCRHPHQPQPITSLPFPLFPRGHQILVFSVLLEDESQKQKHIPHSQFFLALLPWPLYFVLRPFSPQPLPLPTSPLETQSPSFSLLICRWAGGKKACFIYSSTHSTPFLTLAAPPCSPLLYENTKSLCFAHIQGFKVVKNKAKQIWKKHLVSFGLFSLFSTFGNFPQQPLNVSFGLDSSLSPSCFCAFFVNVLGLSLMSWKNKSRTKGMKKREAQMHRVEHCLNDNIYIKIVRKTNILWYRYHRCFKLYHDKNFRLYRPALPTCHQNIWK